MNKTTKTILVILGSLFLLCSCMLSAILITGLWSFSNVVQWTDRSTSEDPEEVLRIGSEIANFDVPDGFGSPYGMYIGDVISVGYVSQSKKTHLIVSQFPAHTSLDLEETLRLINQASDNPDSIWFLIETSLIEEKPVTICGQKTTLSIREGMSSEGHTYRTATAAFQGRGGQALVMVAGPTTEWDIQMIQGFISSIQ